MKIFVCELHFPKGSNHKMFLYLSGELVIEYKTIFGIACVQVCFYLDEVLLRFCASFPKIKGRSTDPFELSDKYHIVF